MRNKRLALAAALLMQFVGCSSTSTVTLNCDYEGGLQEVFSVEPSSSRVRLMSVEPPRVGELSVTDASFHLFFPEKDDPTAPYHQLDVTVNRFTSKAERKLGRERMIGTGTTKLDAAYFIGECKPIKGPSF